MKIITKTGWTTTDLLSAIAVENPSKDYDLVTLLIGVNNQYQGKLENVIVLPIPDYAFTLFGQKSGKAEKITSELKKYDAFVEKISKEKPEFKNLTQQIKFIDLLYETKKV